ncbi:MAG: sugar transferase [Pseudomonadota bacterium]
MTVKRKSASNQSLVIGGSGLLGGHVARQLLDRGEKVMLIDILQPSLSAEHLKSHAFDIADREQLAKILRKQPVDTAWWCIDMAVQPGSKASPDEQLARNMARLKAALPVLAEHGVEHLVFSASTELLSTQSAILDLLRDAGQAENLRISAIICGNLQGGLVARASEDELGERAGIFDQLLRVLLGQRLFINISSRNDLDVYHEMFDAADVARILVASGDSRAKSPGSHEFSLARVSGGAVLTLAEWLKVAEQVSGRTVTCRFQPHVIDETAAPAITQMWVPDDAPAQINDPLLLLQRSLRRLRRSRREHYRSVLDELQRRFPSSGLKWYSSGRLKAWWKRRAWGLAIQTARSMKRLLDISVALSAILALAPLFLITAFIIKSQDGGPVLFWQMRVGRYGREFPFPKFRSMVMDAEKRRAELLEKSHHRGSGNDITFKMKRDPRITPFGRFIRKLSIDELPQLWCVLTGEMSLVGPRPPLPVEVARYNLSDRRRLNIKPGLTCIWQVEGRGDIAFAEQVELDTQYINSQSLWLDIKLLFKTIPAVLIGKGAY